MSVKPKEMETKVIAAGFVYQLGKGKGGHRRYFRESDGKTTEIPWRGKGLRKGTQDAILKQIGDKK